MNSQPQKNNSHGLATAALVFGIVSICLSLVPILNFVCITLGTVAMALGIVALINKFSTGKSVTGLILGAISVIIALVISWLTLSLLVDYIEEQERKSNSYNDLYGSYYTPPTYDDSYGSHYTSPTQEDILRDHLDIQIGTYKDYSYSQYIPETYLPVTIKNKGDVTASFYFEIAAYDKNGNKIYYDNVYVTLKSGETVSEKFFYIVSEETEAKLKNAVFKIENVSMHK